MSTRDFLEENSSAAHVDHLRARDLPQEVLHALLGHHVPERGRALREPDRQRRTRLYRVLQRHILSSPTATVPVVWVDGWSFVVLQGQAADELQARADRV
jgi:anti-sigma factor RsiW